MDIIPFTQSLAWALWWAFTIYVSINALYGNAKLLVSGHLPPAIRQAMTKRIVQTEIMASLAWGVMIVFWFN
jgi:hypothetical protein